MPASGIDCQPGNRPIGETAYTITHIRGNERFVGSSRDLEDAAAAAAATGEQQVSGGQFDNDLERPDLKEDHDGDESRRLLANRFLHRIRSVQCFSASGLDRAAAAARLIDQILVCVFSILSAFFMLD